MSATGKKGIYGGTFDPPHLGHVSAAWDAVRELSLSELLVIPAGIPPHKQLPGDTCPGEMRLEMAKIAFGDIPGVSISDVELQRQGKSYTVDTLREYCRTHPGEPPVLLIGTDMLLSFEGWFQFREILSLAELGVFAREAGDDTRLSETAERFRREYGARITLIPHEPLTASSTEIRTLLRERKGRELLPPEVYRYVMAHRLYGGKPSFDWLREEVLPRLSDHRVKHTLGVETTAVHLAALWGEREELARESAILHDCTKHLDLPNQLKICRKYDIIIDTLERDSVNLLHGKTAAALAQQLYGAAPEAVQAISCHTTGKAGMTTLDMILYLADIIEPGRDFPGVEKLRILAEKDLKKAVYTGLQMSLKNLSDRNINPHPATIEAAKWMSQQIDSGKDGHDGRL